MDLDEVIAGMSEAQKRALIALTETMEVPRCIAVSSNAYKSLNDAWGGILVLSDWRLNTERSGPSHRKAYRLTTKGFAVRARLLAKETDQ